MMNEDLQRLALEECNVTFVHKLNITAILPHLIARHLLTGEEKQTLIQSAKTQVEKAQYLLDIIPRKTKGWFDHFVECLRESTDGTGHHDLVEELEMKFQELLKKNTSEETTKKTRQRSVEESIQPVGGGQNDAREDVYSIFLESSGNHSLHTFTVKGSDTVGRLMDRVRDKLNVDYTHTIKLITDSKEMQLENSLEQSNVRKNSRIVMVLVTHGGDYLEHM